MLYTWNQFNIVYQSYFKLKYRENSKKGKKEKFLLIEKKHSSERNLDFCYLVKGRNERKQIVNS